MYFFPSFLITLGWAQWGTIYPSFCRDLRWYHWVFAETGYELLLDFWSFFKEFMYLVNRHWILSKMLLCMEIKVHE